ncbi:MAG: SDR family NAD(P)-dependent oxidoreductase [Chthoniobacterales bacterium]|nr:SDR family NAD(P)-dependent oxidoreductase [Chthoniobacterales bacterium]
MPSFQFQNSCALITGASSGLGAEFARQLAPHAKRLILVARRAERLKALSQELRQAYPHLCIDQKAADLSLAQEREKLAAWIEQEKLPLNFLINNAGLGDLGDFFHASWERLEEIIELNITALTHLTHLLLPALRKQAPSALLQVGSIVGFFPLLNYGVYAASKAYVNSFSQALHIEEASHGVTVTLLAPGPTPTEFFEQAARLGKKISVTSRAPACFITSQKEVVAVALKAILRNQAIIIPNKKLSIMVSLLRRIPFCLFQKFISK